MVVKKAKKLKSRCATPFNEILKQHNKKERTKKVHGTGTEK